MKDTFFFLSFDSPYEFTIHIPNTQITVIASRAKLLATNRDKTLVDVSRKYQSNSCLNAAVVAVRDDFDTVAGTKVPELTGVSIETERKSVRKELLDWEV